MKKKSFTVSDFASIDACLKQIEHEGYQVTRRIEKPIFKEGINGPEVYEQSIVFEAKKK